MPFEAIRGIRLRRPYRGSGEGEKGENGVYVEAELTVGVQGQSGVPKQGDEALTFCHLIPVRPI